MTNPMKCLVPTCTAACEVGFLLCRPHWDASPAYARAAYETAQHGLNVSRDPISRRYYQAKLIERRNALVDAATAAPMPDPTPTKDQA